MRIQITVDNDFGEMIQERASELGFSVSSYLRYILKANLKSTKKKQSKIDEILLEKSETITLKKFKDELELLKNA